MRRRPANGWAATKPETNEQGAQMMGRDELDPATFERLRRILHHESGIFLDDSKQAFVDTRVRPRLEATGCPTFEDYARRLSAGWGDELGHLITVMSTNFTSFYREASHFDAVGAAYRRWVDEGRRRIRIWSAGCSSGEEPYTLAMTLREAIPLNEAPPDLDVKILATDVSTRVLQHAMAGVYAPDVVEPVPGALRHKYLKSDGSRFSIRKELKDLVLFRHLNLKDMPFPFGSPFDLIMCRNVMIYFDHDFRVQLVEEFERLLRPGGYMIVSHSESLIGIDAELETVEPSVYARTGTTKLSRV